MSVPQIDLSGAKVSPDMLPTEPGKEGSDVLVETIDLDMVYELRSCMPSLKDRHPDTYGMLIEPVKA